MAVVHGELMPDGFKEPSGVSSPNGSQGDNMNELISFTEEFLVQSMNASNHWIPVCYKGEPVIEGLYRHKINEGLVFWWLDPVHGTNIADFRGMTWDLPALIHLRQCGRLVPYMTYEEAVNPSDDDDRYW